MKKPSAARAGREFKAAKFSTVDCAKKMQAAVRNRNFREASFGEAAIAAAMETARRLWPVKTAARLAACAGVSQRRAEQWLAEDAGLSGEALIEILHSPHGGDFLVALMSVAPAAAWWTAQEREMRKAALRRQLAELEGA